MTEARYTWRVLVITLTLIAIWIGLGLRLAFLHLGSNEALQAKVQRIRYHEERILGRRGRVLDVNGHVLAMDLTVKHVIADPREILRAGRKEVVGDYLSRLLDLEPAAVLARLDRPHRQYECIKRNVDIETAKRIERMQLRGVRMEEHTLRHYPLGETLSHVVGFSDQRSEGQAGVERAMDKYLRPRAGLRVSQQDGKGNPLYTQRSLDIEPEDGADIHLTVDERLQYIVEKALAGAMERHHAKGAWAIVERVKTGEILAMAANPAYDPNEYNKTDYDRMLNRAIGYSYEPGSTMKIGIIAAALNEGVVTPDEIFDCEQGLWAYGGKRLKDYHSHGLLSVADILKESSNIGAAKIALKLGNKRTENYLRDFGIGRKTGLELPGEEAGLLSGSARWSAISITRIAMGHEVMVTSLQMLNLLCCIANDGFLMRPFVVRSIMDARGQRLLDVQPEVVSRPIREDTARLMSRLLCRVTEEGGTGTKACVAGYTVAGKTGTAQKGIAGRYSDSANVASFLGFLPAERPEIAIVVVVDEPQPLHTGGQVAAPVFREIAEQAVRCLDIPPVGAGGLLLTQREEAISPFYE